MKKFLLMIVVLIIIGVGAVWFFKGDILQIFKVSAEKVIKDNLPKYITVDNIVFDLEGKRLLVKGFAIKNPKGFQNKHLATIETITCKYTMQGDNILDGINITDIEGSGAIINIERLPGGKLNLNEMGKMMEEETPSPAPVQTQETEKKGPSLIDKLKDKAMRGRQISDIIKLTNTINVTNGKLTLLDKEVSSRPFYLTFEDVNGTINISLNSDYTSVNSAGSAGSGFLNGDRGQRISWVVSMDPRASNLTMSNRIEPENVDITLFKPYYDRYSPVNITNGRVSGSLVLDFDNGNIGSMNTIRIRDLKFTESSGGNASNFWDTSISDVIKYLEASPGEVVFDFKIKGTMQNPRFYPGPNVTKAIQNMAVDKISQLIQGTQQQGQGGQAAGSAAAAGSTQPKSDTQMIMDVIQGLMQKGN